MQVPFISTKHGSADIVGAIAKQRWSKKDNMKITLMEPQIKQDYDKGKTGTDLQVSSSLSHCNQIPAMFNV